MTLKEIQIAAKAYAQVADIVIEDECVKIKDKRPDHEGKINYRPFKDGSYQKKSNKHILQWLRTTKKHTMTQPTKKGSTKN